MGIDRFLPASFAENTALVPAILELATILERFGMTYQRLVDTDRKSSTDAISLFASDNRSSAFDLNCHEKFSSIPEAAKFLGETDSIGHWNMRIWFDDNVYDAKNRPFGGLEIAGHSNTTLNSFEFNCTHPKLSFMFDSHRSFADATGRNVWEEELIELEHQEYHLCKTLFETLPSIDLIFAMLNLGEESELSYCFSRTKNPKVHKNKRLVELEAWCDDHPPEFWKDGASLPQEPFFGDADFDQGRYTVAK